MYLLFKEKNIMPSDFFNRSIGEQIVIREFFDKELEDRIEEKDAMMDSFNGRM